MKFKSIVEWWWMPSYMQYKYQDNIKPLHRDGLSVFTGDDHCIRLYVRLVDVRKRLRL